MPSVSAIVPTYNRAESLPRAIESVLAQTVDDVEVVVVDDASTDDTQAVLAAYADDSRVRTVRHEENQGGNAARNTGLERARGEYVALLDSDDEWHPEKLERQLARIEQGEEYVAVYCDWEYELESATGDVARLVSSVLSRFADSSGPTEGGREELLEGILADDLHTAAGSTLLVEREVAVDVGGFDETLDRFQDTEFLLRVLDAGALAHVEESLMTRYDTASPSADTYARANERLLDTHEAAVSFLEAEGVDIRGQRTLFVAKHFFAEGRLLAGASHLRDAKVSGHEVPGLVAATLGGLGETRRTRWLVACVAVATILSLATADRSARGGE